MEKDFEIKDGVLVAYSGSGGDVVIPEGVTSIGEFAFFSCKDLASVVIPNSVEEIGGGAFFGCCGLTSIVIPNSVKKIDYKTFNGCTSLASVVIPDSVTEIGSRAFFGCTSLTSIVIPDSVKEIGVRAFGRTEIEHNPQGHIAYKGLNADMTCRYFQYEEGKTYVCDDAKLCKCGFHACLNPLDCFNYYAGDNVVYHEVILEDRSDEANDDDTKVCGRKITIGRRLTLKEMGDAFNKLNERNNYD